MYLLSNMINKEKIMAKDKVVEKKEEEVIKIGVND